ncbi:MAG: hypothetical protein IJ172_00340 [Ruminococcus sp.]|nr:hypothetical protein [Ruminococcus sp.]MBQ8119213.1 hypothetical protein [Ruminococcus sp.]
MKNEQKSICREITDKDIEHAIRTCQWRFAVNGQRNLHLCGGACNICEKLIEDGKCDTLQRLFRGVVPAKGGSGDVS